MSDVLACLGAEWFKLRRRPLPWILLAVMAGFLVLANAAFLLLALAPADNKVLAAAATELRQLVAPPNSLYITLSSVNQIGAMLAIILGAAVVGSEQQWGTLRLLLLRQPRRAVYLTGAILAQALAVLVGLLLAVTAGLLVSLLVTAGGGLAIDWAGLAAALTGVAYYQALLRTYATLLVYLLLGLALTVLTRSLTAGLGAALIYFVLDSILVTGVLNLLHGQLELLPGLGPLIHWARQLLLGYNLTLINSTSAVELKLSGAVAGALDTVAVPPRAIAVVAAYALLFAAIPYLALRRRDLGAGG